MISATPNVYANQHLGNALGAWLLLIVMLCLSAGFLPECLDCLDTDNPERTETLDKGAKEAEKESKKDRASEDDYLPEAWPADGSVFAHVVSVTATCLLSWQNSFIEISTPPPERA